MSAHEIARGLWVWAARVPWLPDVGVDTDRVDMRSLLLGYHSLAETMAMEEPGSCALQVRFEVTPSPNSRVGVVSTTVVGRARSRERAERVGGLVRSCLPPELPLEPVGSADEVRALLTTWSNGPNSDLPRVVEVRRRVEDVSLSPDAGLFGQPAEPAVLAWAPDPLGLRHTIGVLARHPTPAMVLLHMEPARPSSELMYTVDQVLRSVAPDGDPAANPLRAQVARVYRQRLRDLPRACLEVRVLVCGATDIAAGLAESVGVALTEPESFQLVTARTEQEVAHAVEIIEALRARWWAGTSDPLLDETLRLCSSDEAARIVRLPSLIRGGAAGVPSRVVSTLPRAAQRHQAEDAVLIGSAVGGGEARISLRDLNQHVLVAGLPGFGKTVTTQSLLLRLWRSHHVPFLVLDPAKSDYASLAGALGDEVTHVSLSPARVAFNPFGVPTGVPRETHAGRVLAAFDATFRLSEVWPAGFVTLGRAIFDAYERDSDARPVGLASLQDSLADVVERSGFSGSSASDIRAALIGRIDFLRRGPMGVALDGGPEATVDHAALLARPTVVEMREFGGPTERSLLFALLLAGVISYREVHATGTGLGHVTVLEEAHRLLGRSESGTSEGVRLFVEAIAELRSQGEGFVIVDQAPSRLDPGVMKLCGSTIAHRIVDQDERERIGAAVLLDERQQEDLARLPHGQAVAYTASSDSSVVVDVRMEQSLLRQGTDRTVADRLPWRAVPPVPANEGKDLMSLAQACRSEGLGARETRRRLMRFVVDRHGRDPERLLLEHEKVEEAIMALRRARTL
ncbi:hypothetical protein N866_08520 [Actinotalea ferrariae CF5-4]|uniref:Helicase HerA central domain-containing protein n=1 Tax=Actinotalea ferrariae CF5-4 TaxID=948458 RepID=A0A021VQY5_9CELL|nr:ATP-binding protein [Actinotalea ferrariae]EYR62440.1 hypothetical protein N866_08520 [Actinotalea ferrariae CF5-4]